MVAAEADLLGSGGHEVVQYQVENPGGGAGAAGALALAAWNPAARRRLAAVAEEVRPDVAHVHNTWFSLSPAVVRALKQTGTPVVMTLHNFRLVCANALLFRQGQPCQLCVGSNPWHGVRHRCYRDSFTASAVAATTIAINRTSGTWTRNVDLFVALSEFAADRFIAGGLPADRIVVKPNFVDDPGVRPHPPSDSGVVLFVGRLYEAKGVLELIDAWAAAAPKDLELVIVGDGPLRPMLEQRPMRSVRLAGSLDRGAVLDLMLRARALAFPSRLYEGQPMAILEALAAGLPVLVSDHSGMAPTLAELPPGTLIDNDQPGAWQRAIAALADDAAVDAAGRASRRLYQTTFTPELALAQLEGAYHRAGVRP